MLDYNPGRDWRLGRGLLFHKLSILYPLLYVNRKKLALSLPGQVLLKYAKTQDSSGNNGLFQENGAMQGQYRGKLRAEKLSPERRREIAQKAIATRWAKRNAN